MLKDSAQRVQNALTRLGYPYQVQEVKDTAHTAEDAASALQCEVGQIVKSLIFQGAESHTPYLLLVSGANRVDVTKVKTLVGEPVKRAEPDWIKTLTGFAIGGIPPIGHNTAFRTIMDERLLQHARVWAAAGHPHAVFPCSPEDLIRMTKADVADIHQS